MTSLRFPLSSVNYLSKTRQDYSIQLFTRLTTTFYFEMGTSLEVSVRTVRVFVEPIEVELDEDGGLQWSSLASAFPGMPLSPPPSLSVLSTTIFSGCSNLYYKGDENLKTMVKFDGKKFVRSGGCWNDNTYYVTLGKKRYNFYKEMKTYR